MVLDVRSVDFTFSSGLSEREDDFLVSPPKWSVLRNVRMRKDGSMQKRFGSTALGTSLYGGGNLAEAAVTAGFRDEHVICSSASLYSRVDATSQWVNRDRLQLPTVKRTMIAQGPQILIDAGVAVGGGMLIYTWLSDRVAATFYRGNVYALVVDASTGAVILGPTQLTTGQTSMNPKVVVSGAYAKVIYADNAGNIKARTLLLATPTSFAAAVNLVVDAIVSANNVPYDAAPVEGATTFAIVYEKNAAAPNVRIARFTDAAVATSAVTSTEAAAPAKQVFAVIAISADNQLWVAYSYNDGAGNFLTRLAGVNLTTGLENRAPFTIRSTAAATEQVDQLGLARRSSTEVQVVANTFGGGGGFWTQMGNFAGALVGARRITEGFSGIALQSKPFVVNGKGYVQIVKYSSIQGTHYLVDTGLDDTSANAYPARVVARMAPGLSGSLGGILRSVSSLSSFAAVSATDIVLAVQTALSSAIRSGVGQYRFNFDNWRKRRAIELGDNLHLSGGNPMYFDGTTVAEIGFDYYPEVGAATTSVVGAGMTPGTRVYQFTYQYTDAKGQVHESAPSPPVSVTTANALATNRATLTIPTLVLTARQDFENGFKPQVSIVIYRTIAGGSVRQRLTPDETPAGLLNDPTVGSITWNDDAPDSDLSGRPPIYTTGPSGRGRRAHTAPPCMPTIVLHKRRLFGVGDDARSIWFSGERVEREAIWFSDTQVIPSEYDVSALGSLDTSLVIFGSHAGEVALLYGDGPTDTGDQNDYTTPKRVPSTVGCIDQRSVVTSPDGCWFQADDKQLYLLTRDEQVIRASSPVEDTLTVYPVITSATLVPSESVIVWTCQESEGSEAGVRVVYDYIAKQWMTDRVVVGSSLISAQSATLHNGVYKWVTDDGVPYKEDPTTFLDAGTWITQEAVSAWFKPAGLQGFARLRRWLLLAVKLTDHDLAMQIGRDFEAAYNQTRTWLRAELATLPVAREQPDMHVVNQKGEAFRVRLYDATPTGGTIGTGKGATWKALSFLAGVKRGANKQPKEART